MYRSRTIMQRSPVPVITANSYDTKNYKNINTPHSTFFSSLVHEYCKKSTLHGLKYLQNNKLQYSERFFWLIMFLISLIISVIMILGVWDFWSTHPFVLVYNIKPTYINDIPFPSVTVCSYFSIKKSYVDLTKTTDRKILHFSKFVCPKYYKSLDDYYQDSVLNDFYEFLNNASLSCPEMLKRCTWQNKEVDCCSIFRPIVTEFGLCHVFNSLPHEILYKSHTHTPFPKQEFPLDTLFWDLEGGYPKEKMKQSPNATTLPIWAKSTGEGSALTVELFQNLTEWQEVCSGAYSGFRIIIHSPGNGQTKCRNYLHIEMNRETVIALTPIVINSKESVRNISPRKRMCYFNGEKYLQYYKMYTGNNCIYDCLSLQCYDMCGCVPFYFPRNTTIPICSKPFERVCSSVAIYHLITSTQKNALSGLQPKSFCDCYPSCTSIEYSYKIYYSDFLYTGKPPPWGGTQVFSEDQVTRINIYFQSGHFHGKHRKVQYTLYEFIGTCGGLLGLFLGFSILSGFEMFYFFILKPIGRIFNQQIKHNIVSSFIQNKH